MRTSAAVDAAYSSCLPLAANASGWAPSEPTPLNPRPPSVERATELRLVTSDEVQRVRGRPREQAGDVVAQGMPRSAGVGRGEQAPLGGGEHAVGVAGPRR